jgi:hypothetical protein
MTYGLGNTTTCSFAIPVARSLSIECFAIPIENERASATGCANFEKWSGPLSTSDRLPTLATFISWKCVVHTGHQTLLRQVD